MRFLEAAMIVVLAAALIWPVRSNVRAIFSTIPLGYTAFSVLLLLLLVVGQTAGSSNGAFPLVEWDMHTEPATTDVVFMDYTIEASGREERLMIGQLLPIGRKELRERIDRAALAATEPGVDAARRDAMAHLDAMLGSLVEVYRDAHGGIDVDAVRVWRCTIPVADYAGPESIDRTLLYEYRAGR